MAKYLFSANYTPAGLQGLLKEGGSGRKRAIESAVASAGGTLESIHWAFGKHDVYVIADAPDNIAAAALSLRITAAGAATVSTTVLMTAEEVDAAVAKSPSYRPPGG